MARPRYRDLISGLQFVARQEIIFGIHVHVGIDDPDKAIHVTNGMRVHLPVLLALSANSPFWRGDDTGLESARTPIFRAFPRVGIPPRYDNFEDWSTAHRVHDQLAVDRRLHLPLVRRPPASQLRDRGDPGDGLPDAAWSTPSRWRRWPRRWSRSWPSTSRRARSCRTTPTRCSTRTSGWPRGTGSGASWWTCPRSTGCTVPDLAKRLIERLRPHAEELGSADELDGLEDILDQRQRRRPPARGLPGQPRPPRGGAGGRGRHGAGNRRRSDRLASPRPGTLRRAVSQPDLFVVCKNCGSEVSPYVTECPYCGQRVRKRAPKIDRGGGPPEPPKRRRRAEAAAAASRGDRGHRARHPALRDVRCCCLACVAAILVWAADAGLDIGYVIVPVARTTCGASSPPRSCSPTSSATPSSPWWPPGSSARCSSAASGRCR